MLRFVKTKPLYLIVDALIVLACAGGIYQLFQKPGMKAVLYYREQHLAVRYLDVDLAKTPLRRNDLIKTIDQKPVTRIEQVEFLLDQKSIGQQVEVGIIRDGKPLRLQITLQRYNRSIYLIVLLLVCPIFLLLGLLVLFKRPVDDRAAVSLHWFSAAIALYVSSTFGHYAPLWFVPPIVFRGLHFLTIASTPVMFLHFSLLFPGKIKTGSANWLRPLYLAAVLFGLLASGVFYRAVQSASEDHFQLFMIVFNSGRLLFSLPALAGLVVFLRSYRLAAEESERRQLRWILLGLTIAVAGFTGLWQLPQALGFTPLVRGEAILLSILFIPFTFSIAVIRYHLLNIDLVFKRSTVYFIVIGTLLLVYALLVSIAALIVGRLTVRASLVVSALAAVVIALLFEPLKLRVKFWVDKKFFRQQYNYRLAQRELSYAINQYLNGPELQQFVLHKLSELIQPRYLVLYTFQKTQARYQPAASVDLPESLGEVESYPGSGPGQGAEQIFGLEAAVEKGARFVTVNQPQMTRDGLALIITIPGGHQDKPDLLFLGQKKSGLRYSTEDIDFILVACRQLASALNRIRLQQKLLEQAAETKRLEELNKLKSLFVSGVTHELRTPLTSIRMFAELLKEQPELNSATRAEYADIIRGEGQRLERLVDNILEFTQSEQAGIHISPGKVDMKELLDKALRVMHYPLQSYNVQVNLDVGSGPLWVRADADALLQVLTNLLDNAIKYGGEQKTISLSVKRQKDSVYLSVSDRGPGIPPQEQQKIFQPFYRLPDDQLSSVSGTGLGLAVVRQIVEAHKGKIEVDSTVGQGTTFRVILPGGGKA